MRDVRRDSELKKLYHIDNGDNIRQGGGSNFEKRRNQIPIYIDIQ